MIYFGTMYIANTEESDQPGINAGIIVVIALSVLRLILHDLVLHRHQIWP